MARRGAGEGSVYKESATGRWRVKVRLPDGRIKRMNAANQQEAIRKLKEFRPPRAGGEVTVTAYAKEWLNEVEQARVETGDIRARTLAWKRQMLEFYVIPAIGKRRLSELRVTDVMWLLKGMAHAGLSRATIKGVRGVLCQMLDQAGVEERVDKNVARLAIMPAGIQPSIQKRESMTLDEARAMLAAVRGERLEALFVTALMLGLRPGELLGLRWADVDFEEATIYVNGSLGADGMVGDTKTEESKQTLEAPGLVLDALRAHKVRQAQERLKASKPWPDNDMVFASRVGTPTSHGALRKINKRICEAAGLGKWTPHEYRHTAGSLLLDAGVHREDVRRILRHKNMRMIDQVYGHEIRPTVSAAVGPMEELFKREAAQ
jgi:integrase